MVPYPSPALCARPAMSEIHTDLSPGSRCHIVLLCPKWTRLPTMSTIELVDPELRDALALWPQVPLTDETLARRRADADQNHSIPDNLVALFGRIRAWNYSAETARSAVGCSSRSGSETVAELALFPAHRR